ncbi:MAG TPA: radical SAM protein [Candidatus Hydrogenedentes bacterium]|nr:radical SAM protein [Candidatus Hydrogenedentota bacterium]HOV72350.1 radical SAM protein [Candidatus Hydrogenedentota bacterium]
MIAISTEKDTLLNRLRCWERGETPGPWCISVFPTNRCNIRCVMCWQRYFENDTSHELSDERLLHLVDEAAALGCQDWIIQGGGEPLMRATLVMRMCERIRQHGMNGRLVTNATLLKPSHIRTLIEIGWDNLTVSIDGATAEVHDAIRGQGTFRKTASATSRCAEMRRETNSPWPRIQISTTLMRHNYSDLPGIVELAHRLGCDSILADLTCLSFGRDNLITPEQRQELPGIVEQAVQRGRELGIVTDFDHLTISPWAATFLRNPWRASEPPPRMFDNAWCYAPWYAMSVFANGGVAPCTMDWNRTAPNLASASLAEIWEGPYFARARDRMALEQSLDCCDKCPVLFSGHTLSLRPMDDAYALSEAAGCPALAGE